MVESEVVDFFDEYAKDEDEGTFEIPPYKNIKGGILIVYRIVMKNNSSE